MRRVRRLVIAPAAAVIGAVALERFRGRRDLAAHPAPGRLIDVGGYRLHLDVTGDGEGPLVVLEAALGGSSLDWTGLGEINGMRVCRYDRAGFGWSDRAPRDRMAPVAQVEALHTALERAGMPPPYVLVGHSLGGIYVQVFARMYPEDVAGMVLVDGAHPDLLRRLPAEAARQQFRMIQLLRWLRFLAPLGLFRVAGKYVANVDTLPEQVRPLARALGYQTKCFFAIYDEVSQLVAADPADVAARPLPDVPLVVLTSGSHRELPHAELSLELQKELAALVPRGRQVPVDGSGHFIQTDDPAAVREAIIDVTALASGRG